MPLIIVLLVFDCCYDCECNYSLRRLRRETYSNFCISILLFYFNFLLPICSRKGMRYSMSYFPGHRYCDVINCFAHAQMWEEMKTGSNCCYEERGLFICFYFCWGQI